MDIGGKIRTLRVKAGVTQEKLAAELGVSSQSVSKWENNVCAPDISLLPKLSEFFGITLDELFDLSTDQRLSRMENMLDLESELSPQQFAETERALLELLPDYDTANPERVPGRIESLLGHLYHHRMLSDARKVSDYARRAMRLHPDVKEDQWLLTESEGAAVSDWNVANHSKTIAFFRELVQAHPEVGRNYLYLLDNLLADRRTAEARQYLDTYSRLEGARSFLVDIYSARIALGEFRPEEAKQILERMETEAPDDFNTLFELAGTYASLCEYDRAVELYERSYALDIRPRFYDPLEGISVIYEIQGRYADALKIWDRVEQNLREEWQIAEGSVLDSVEWERKRLTALMK